MTCTGVGHKSLLPSFSSDLGFQSFTWPHGKALRRGSLALFLPWLCPKGSPSVPILSTTLLPAKHGRAAGGPMHTNRRLSDCRVTEHQQLKVVGCGSGAVHGPGQPKALGSIPSTAGKKENSRH